MQKNVYVNKRKEKKTGIHTEIITNDTTDFEKKVLDTLLQRQAKCTPIRPRKKGLSEIIKAFLFSVYVAGKTKYRCFRHFLSRELMDTSN